MPRLQIASRALRKPGAWIALCLLLGTLAMLFARGQRYENFVTETPLNSADYLVIGFMGGRDSWDDERRGVRKLVLKLRAMDLEGVHVETVENKKRKLAVELVRKAFDFNRNGALDEDERRSARLIVYGHSFGGAAVVKFARQLQALDVPILLTVQIDSVGLNDAVIPSNVRRAANLFQPNGLIIKGESKIRAQDPAKTEIVGNFKYDYSKKDIDISHVHWFKKLFRVAHTKMGHDPDVWAKVEALILSAIESPRGEPASGPVSDDSSRG